MILKNEMRTMASNHASKFSIFKSNLESNWGKTGKVFKEKLGFSFIFKAHSKNFERFALLNPQITDMRVRFQGADSGVPFYAGCDKNLHFRWSVFGHGIAIGQGSFRGRGK